MPDRAAGTMFDQALSRSMRPSNKRIQRTGVCRKLQFSYGVQPVQPAEWPADWLGYARAWGRDHLPDASLALLVTGAGALEAGGSRRIEVLALR
jgi:hypothetical protein